MLRKAYLLFKYTVLTCNHRQAVIGYSRLKIPTISNSSVTPFFRPDWSKSDPLIHLKGQNTHDLWQWWIHLTEKTHTLEQHTVKYIRFMNSFIQLPRLRFYIPNLMHLIIIFSDVQSPRSIRLYRGEKHERIIQLSLNLLSRDFHWEEEVLSGRGELLDLWVMEAGTQRQLNVSPGVEAIFKQASNSFRSLGWQTP